MQELIIVLVLALAVVIAVKFWRHRQNERLRDHPPVYVTTEVRLPAGMDDANECMRAFYRSAAPLLEASGKDKRRGRRQVDFVHLARHEEEGMQATLTFYMRAPKELNDQLKRSLRSRLRGKAVFITPPSDAILELR